MVKYIKQGKGIGEIIMKKTFIDLDGVILNTEELLLEEKENKYPNIGYYDYFQNYANWLETARKSNSINHSVEIIRELEYLKKRLIILTKINSVREMEQKLFHLRNERLINSPIMFVPFDALKSQIAMPSSGDILVDDTISNIYDWELCGGCPYLFNNHEIEYHNKVRSLEFLLKK